MDKLKLIKTAVFILTFLLLFGIISLLGLLYQKNQNKDKEVATHISLQQPQGSYIKEMTNTDDKIYILTVGGGQEDRIIVLDNQTLKPITSLSIN